MAYVRLVAAVGIPAIVLVGAVIIVSPLGGDEGDVIPFTPCNDECGPSIVDQMALMYPDDENALLAVRFRDALDGRDGVVNIFADLNGNGVYDGDDERLVTDEPVQAAPDSVHVFRGKAQKDRKRDLPLTFIFTPGRLSKPDPKQSKPPATRVTNVIIRTGEPLPLTGAWPWEGTQQATATATSPPALAATPTAASAFAQATVPPICIAPNGQIPCPPGVESSPSPATASPPATTTSAATAVAAGTAGANATAAVIDPPIHFQLPSPFGPFGFDDFFPFGLPADLFGPVEPPREAEELPPSVLEYLEERFVPS